MSHKVHDPDAKVVSLRLPAEFHELLIKSAGQRDCSITARARRLVIEALKIEFNIKSEVTP